MKWNLKTPVAFLIFNRSETTKRVFAEIAKVKPPKLLVIADGPRSNKPEEMTRCQEAREIINQVDWDCDVLKNYSDVNLGCKKRVSSGLNWVFKMVEEAIILEDDCLPHPTFFRFCEELLEKYRDETRISQISGSNFLFNKFDLKNSYYFSKFQFVWGWASWRRVWKHYDVNMKKWPSFCHTDDFKRLIGNKKISDYYTKIFEKVYKEKIDTWDYQWFFSNLVKKKVSIIPKYNLISNIGFGHGATHTNFLHPLANIQLDQMEFALSHPQYLNYNRLFDEHVFFNYVKISKLKRIFLKIKAIL